MFSVFETSGKDLSWIDKDNYILADTKEVALECIRECFMMPDTQAIGFDTEETGLSLFVDELVGISLCPRPGRAFYIPIAHKFDRNVALQDILPELEEMLVTKTLVGHNAEFDWVRIKKYLGFDINLEYCTSIQACLIDSDLCQHKEKRGLDKLSEEHLGITMLQMHDLPGIPQGSYNFSLADTANGLYYAAADADVALRLFEKRLPVMRKLGLETVYDLEMKVMKASGEMFLNGSKADETYLGSLNLTERIEALSAKIHESVGDINLNSPEQVAALLFDRLGLERVSGNSVDDKTLSVLSGAHPVVEHIRSYRTYDKLQHGFIEKMADAISEDGRIHSSFDQMGARSGRFSSSGGIGRKGAKLRFNAQTLPKPNEENPDEINMRQGIVAEDGHILLSQDYSQIEMLVLANASGQPQLLDGIRNGVDFHVATASLFLGIPLANISKNHRKQGKELNFAAVYGFGDVSLAQKLGVPLDAAKELKTRYWNMLDRVKALRDDKKAFAKKNHYIQTEFGRIRWYRELEGLDNWEAGRILGSCWNTYVQGTAADLNKIGLARARSAINRYKFPAKMLSTIHDELNLEVLMAGVKPREILPVFSKAMRIKEGMVKNWLEFPTEITVGFTYGTMISVPETYYDKFDSWEELMAACQEYADKKKVKPKVIIESSPKVDVASSSFNLGDLSVSPKKASRIKPSLQLAFSPGSDIRKALEVLNQQAQYNHGLYAMYFQVDPQHEFLASKIKVNPSERFLKAIQAAGIRVTVHPPEEELVWDPSAVRF